MLLKAVYPVSNVTVEIFLFVTSCTWLMVCWLTLPSLTCFSSVTLTLAVGETILKRRKNDREIVTEFKKKPHPKRCAAIAKHELLC